MNGILGTKIGMTQVFQTNGKILPVTVIYCEPNSVISVKTKEKDGYIATQLGYETVTAQQLNKPKQGIYKKYNNGEFKRCLKEVRDMAGYTVGQKIVINDLFAPGQFVDVQANNKGHGYTGPIKLWNYKIGPLSHGAGYKHRYQGSIETGRGGSQAQRVFKGKKMAARWGNEQVTIRNLAIVKIIPEDNIVLIHGAIPGPKGAMVLIKSSKNKANQIQKFDLVVAKNTTKASPEQPIKTNVAHEDAVMSKEANESPVANEKGVNNNEKDN